MRLKLWLKSQTAWACFPAAQPWMSPRLVDGIHTVGVTITIVIMTSRGFSRGFGETLRRACPGLCQVQPTSYSSSVFPVQLPALPSSSWATPSDLTSSSLDLNYLFFYFFIFKFKKKFLLATPLELRDLSPPTRD